MDNKLRTGAIIVSRCVNLLYGSYNGKNKLIKLISDEEKPYYPLKIQMYNSSEDKTQKVDTATLHQY